IRLRAVAGAVSPAGSGPVRIAALDRPRSLTLRKTGRYTPSVPNSAADAVQLPPPRRTSIRFHPQRFAPMFHAPTILAVRLNDRTVLAGDGQVTFGQTVMKQNARKIRRLYHDRILAGFAGSAADSFALFQRFEAKLEQYRGNLERSAVELARDWRK